MLNLELQILSYDVKLSIMFVNRSIKAGIRRPPPILAINPITINKMSNLVAYLNLRY